MKILYISMPILIWSLIDSVHAEGDKSEQKIYLSCQGVREHESGLEAAPWKSDYIISKKEMTIQQVLPGTTQKATQKALPPMHYETDEVNIYVNLLGDSQLLINKRTLELTAEIQMQQKYSIKASCKKVEEKL
jgi:hypothetical protein